MPLLLCPGTLVAWLTFPARPCLPAVWSDACQLPGALLLENLLHPWAPHCAVRAQQELQAAGTLLVLM